MLELIETETFDLAISDVQMPIMDGPEAIQALRARRRLKFVLGYR